MINEELILSLLKKCWSMESSSLWTEENPAKGQCGVTALVINDLYNGEITKTKLLNGQWHYYNFIDGKRYDFTKSQFNFVIQYQDIPSNRKEAFLDTNEKQYNYLIEKFNLNYLKS